MRNSLFELKIVAFSWHGQNELSPMLPEGAAVELATAIRAWYEGLHDKVRFLVRCVEVHPPVSSSGEEWLHVLVTTCGLGGESNVGSIPSGEARFIYDWATKSVSSGAKEQISLTAALDMALRSILSHELDLLDFAKVELEKAIVAHSSSPPEQ